MRQAVKRTLGKLVATKLARRIVLVGTVVLLVVSVLGVGLIHTLASAASMVELPNSVPPQVAVSSTIGRHDPNATIYTTILFKLRNQAGMDGLLQTIYDPHSTQYHQWLRQGQFGAMFGPSSSQAALVSHFLQQNGLTSVSSVPGSLVEAFSGTTHHMELAFGTTINDYRQSDGSTFYANGTNIHIPFALITIVEGVLISDLSPDQPLEAQMPPQDATNTIAQMPATSRCTYGQAGGFTPCQIRDIYDANAVYNSLHDTGKGVSIALYELSEYQHSDIAKYEQEFHLPNVSIVNKDFLSFLISHGGASEVALDIEMAMALAPGISHLYVYNAPGFFASLEYSFIAGDDIARVVSTSWGACEHERWSFELNNENNLFKQMAMQGQTVLAASGDAGAFACADSSLTGTNALRVDDPGSQPYVTSVGGTSFQGVTFDANFDYPFKQESVWNDGCVAPLCKNGAGGGGVSRYWKRPSYQIGPGVNEPSSQSGSWCGQSKGVGCREVPDISLNAGSGYAVYCTDQGDSKHYCPKSGWIGLGGTSAAAPLWAAIVALMDANHFAGGFLNPFVYSYDTRMGACFEFHDITKPGDNGHYPVGTGYDMATGVGTADIYYLVTRQVQPGCAHGGSGRLWLTGHDTDFHCSAQSLSCNYMKVALTYVRNGSSLPVLALDHGSEVAQAITDAFGGSAPTVVTVDPRTHFATTPLFASDGSPLYSAIVVASDITCGGCDNNNGFGDTPDSNAINARATDIAQFFNAGGGILGLAGAQNIPLYYGFSPIPASPIVVTPPFTFTPLGTMLGLVQGPDNNCCATHNSFTLPGSGSPFQVVETDAAGAAETIIAQDVVASTAPRPIGTLPSKPPKVPGN